jgi:hypothetical protein
VGRQAISSGKTEDLKRPKQQREMKTPIEEAIEKVQSLRQIDAVINPIGVIESILSNMLEKEKALLIKTHGNKKVYDSEIDPTIVTGEEWYDKTFNTKER